VVEAQVEQRVVELAERAQAHHARPRRDGLAPSSGRGVGRRDRESRDARAASTSSVDVAVGRAEPTSSIVAPR
jgi:hypothetical protein